MKTRELIYIVLDLCKLASDDSYFTEEHVEWLLSKNRSFLLKREEERLKLQIPSSSRQTICVCVQPSQEFCGDRCEDVFIKSVAQVPDLVSGSIPVISTMSYFASNISFVPFEKMKYVNYNKYLRNIIYAAIGPDKYIYMKSSNPVFENLSKIKVTGVFDDFQEAASMACNENGETLECDSMDMEFPIESYLVPELVDRVLRELLGAAYRGQDKRNDGTDSLSDIANYINRYLKRGDLRDNINGEQ